MRVVQLNSVSRTKNIFLGHSIHVAADGGVSDNKDVIAIKGFQRVAISHPHYFFSISDLLCSIFLPTIPTCNSATYLSISLQLTNPPLKILDTTWSFTTLQLTSSTSVYSPLLSNVSKVHTRFSKRASPSKVEISIKIGQSSSADSKSVTFPQFHVEIKTTSVVPIPIQQWLLIVWQHTKKHKYHPIHWFLWR